MIDKSPTDDCDSPLGMESGQIPDSAITASSSYVPNVGPRNGRKSFLIQRELPRKTTEGKPGKIKIFDKYFQERTTELIFSYTIWD
ncbi:hypothetical protein M8J76_013756 [Diaphorina citri]|nr:hypothetical protein M8J76_013756 [Diaphorina citri]